MVYIGFSLKLSKSLCVLIFFFAMLGREAELFLAYLAAFIHECAHGASAIFLGINPKGISLGIFGIKLTMPDIAYSKDKILIYAAGPGISFVVCAYLYMAGRLFSFNFYLFDFFVFANFVIGIINLLPVYPLDGFAVLKAVFTMHLGLIKAAKKARLTAAVFYFLTGSISFLLCLCGVFNPSIPAIFLFLFLNKGKESYQYVAEKKHVLSGEIVSKKKLKYMACDAESELLCLAECISPDYTLIVAAFCNEKFVGDLNQNDITRGIEKYGALCRVEDYIKNQTYKNKL